MSAPRSIAILGPGGVGGFLAAALEHARTPVTVVAREETAAVIERDGIELRSRVLGDFATRPHVVTRLRAPVDALVIATKAMGLEAALERIETEPALVVPLLNGLDHLQTLRARFGAPAVAASVRIESDRPAPGRIEQTSSHALVEAASDDSAMRPILRAFLSTLDAAAVPTRVGASEAEVMWSKLLRLSALACATTAHDLPIGAVREDPELRAELEACVREAAAVASAEGAPREPAEVIAELDGLDPAHGSSMRRDVAAGREPELDAIAGAVLRAGDRHGLACPTLEALTARVADRAAIAPPRRAMPN